MINASLDAQEQMWGKEVSELSGKVDALTSKVTAVVGDPTIPDSGMLPGIAKQISSHIASQTAWRADDVEWRKRQEAEIAATKLLAQSAVTEAANIRKHQSEMKERMQLLSWMMMTVKAVKVTVGAAVGTAEKGKRAYTALAAISSTLLLLWSFFHTMLPALRSMLQLHHFTH